MEDDSGFGHRIGSCGLFFLGSAPNLDGADVSSGTTTSFVFPEIEDQGFNQYHVANPDTVIAWNRKGFRLYWKWKRRRGWIGRPGIAREIRELIRNMNASNVLWGAPRLHGELLKLGIEVS